MPYEVPALPYDYAALEPHIDEATMRVHHDKHHQAYVDKVNAALEGTDWADKPIEEVVANLSQIPDDKRGPVMLQNTAARRATYSLRSAATFRARLVANELHGLHLEVDGRDAQFRLIGVFNAYNLLAVYGAAVLLGEDPVEALTILSGLTTAPGRFEPVSVPGSSRTSRKKARAASGSSA